MKNNAHVPSHPLWRTQLIFPVFGDHLHNEWYSHFVKAWTTVGYISVFSFFFFENVFYNKKYYFGVCVCVKLARYMNLENVFVFVVQIGFDYRPNLCIITPVSIWYQPKSRDFTLCKSLIPCVLYIYIYIYEKLFVRIPLLIIYMWTHHIP